MAKDTIIEFNLILVDSYTIMQINIYLMPQYEETVLQNLEPIINMLISRQYLQDGT